MNLNFHINVNNDDPAVTRVAVADQYGEVTEAEEFRDLPSGVGNRQMRALAWTMGVLLRKVDRGSKVAARVPRRESQMVQRNSTI